MESPDRQLARVRQQLYRALVPAAREHFSLLSEAGFAFEEAPAGAELEDWVSRGHDQLARVTDRLYLIDRERTELDGLAAIRSLSHHVVAEHVAVALEQWTLAGPHALTFGQRVRSS